MRTPVHTNLSRSSFSIQNILVPVTLLIQLVIPLAFRIATISRIMCAWQGHSILCPFRQHQVEMYGFVSHIYFMISPLFNCGPSLPFAPSSPRSLPLTPLAPSSPPLPACAVPAPTSPPQPSSTRQSDPARRPLTDVPNNPPRHPL